jgi:hypothetical protein
MERVESFPLGISYELLLDALSEAGGAIEVDGRYYINDIIKELA